MSAIRKLHHALPDSSRHVPELLIGRHTFRFLARMKLEDITMDYVIVDMLRVRREMFGAFLEAWRDGYSEPIAEHSSLPFEGVFGYFNHLIANIRDPLGNAVWMVPDVSASVPCKSNA